MNLTDRYLDAGFKDYESMKKGLTLNIPENFNFAFSLIKELWFGATIKERNANIPLRIFPF